MRFEYSLIGKLHAEKNIEIGRAVITYNQLGRFFSRDGRTDIFTEQTHPWHKITPLRSARFTTLRE